MPAPHRSLAETLRKPVSILLAVIWLKLAVLAQPGSYNHGWHLAMEYAGYLCLIVAALGRLWAYAQIGGRKNRDLCREGPYSLTRNPLYFFSFIGVVGAGLALENVTLLLATAGSFLVYYHFVIRAEECRLRELFGSAFVSYCAEVPRFWPRHLRLRQSETLTLPTRLFNRNLTEVFWFLALIVAIEAIEHGKDGQWWPTIPLWI